MPPTPTNLKLYEKVKEIARSKFKSWPSAYGSAWLVKEYKRRGGKYKGKKQPDMGLKRWFDEKWINVCELPKVVPCGRPTTTIKNWKKKYPYCRPMRKVNKSTPKIASKLTKKEREKRCAKKRKKPLTRLL